jgi:hypothetical protein
LDEAAESGEAEEVDRFSLFSASIRFCNSALETAKIPRSVFVNLANSGVSGGVFI